MLQRVEPLKSVADRYNLPPDLVAGLVELVEGQGWQGLQHLLKEGKQQRQRQLEEAEGMNEILKAQGGLCALKELESNIRDIVLSVDKLRRIE